MYAIVLSHDRQIQFDRLVVESYRRLWPGCPLVFRVPYNAQDPARVDGVKLTNLGQRR